MTNTMAQRAPRARFAGRLARAAAPAALLASTAPAPARAMPGENLLSAGVFIGHQLGEAGGFEFGLELLATRLFGGTYNRCGSDERTGAGGLLQVGLVSLRDVRVSLAAHGGRMLDGQHGPALSAELGASYRTGVHGGFGIHTGVLGELSALNVALRYQWLRNEAWAGVGLRYLPTYATHAHCDVGRPLRTDRGRAYVAQPMPCVVTPHVDEQQARQAQAGRGFARDAQLEAASVPAFLQLARELANLGAPAALITRALQAAGDELRHAELCAGIAARYLAQDVQPCWPLLPERSAADAGLTRLAVESWLDGCLMEGIAATQAAAAARAATDPQAQAVQARIADDEHRHSELAWSILSWAIDRGGRPVRGAVLALRDAEVLALDAAAAPDGLQVYGRLDHGALNALAACHQRTARDRLRASV